WVRKNKQVSAKERLVITEINFMKDWKKEFEESHCFEKINRIQMLFYEHNNDAKQCMISNEFFYEYDKIPEADKKIIENDYNRIIEKIKSGNAHEISEGDSDYLGACTKGATAESSKGKQPFSDSLAPSRAFTFKTSYMTQILRDNVFYKYTSRDNLIKDINMLNNRTISDVVKSFLDIYKGKRIDEISNAIGFDLEKKKGNYDFLYKSISKMLHTNLDNPDKIDEFLKSGIKVITVRIMKNGRNKESVSMPAFKISELIAEEWYESTLRDTFLNTKFLICVFDEIDDKNKNYIFRDSFFWTMDEHVLDSVIKSVWEDTKRIFIEGVKLELVKWGQNFRVENNLPKESEQRIIHVRPHTSESTYKFDNILIHEEYLQSFGDVLPDGRIMTKQCFFINKNFILDLINKQRSN
ncbi:MAG: Sau3AI family type II restriction endonuclease, partial [Coprobacillus sp.]